MCMKHLKIGLFVAFLCSASFLLGQDRLLVVPGISLPPTGVTFALDIIGKKPVQLPIPPPLITYNPNSNQGRLLSQTATSQP